jgi:molybdopterin synthase sulfur carrier subunit
MAVKVLIPTPLQKLTNGEGEATAEGGTIREVISSLNAQFPGIQDRLYGPNGGLVRFLNVYVNSDDIRFLQNEDTAVKDGDEISLVPAVAGG